MPNTLDKSFLERSVWKADIFKGKVAFITGGAGSICRVQAEALVLLGAKAALIGRNSEKTERVAREVSQLGAGADSVIGIGGVDVRNVEDLTKAVEITVKKFGRIDFLIAGAAGNFIADFTNLSTRAFKSVVDIDLLGTFNTVKALLLELVKTKGVVLLVSATLHYTGTPFQSHVSAAKSGIDALSNSLAVELGPMGIRVNCIAPGAIADTEGLQRLSKGVSFDNIVKKIPLQRAGSKEEIAETTVYLLSPASRYTTGDIAVVDGGAWHVGNIFGSSLYPHFLVESQQRGLERKKGSKL